jgi:HD-GYP domain-containing protein (c-di-GMP phosphodiesterase class II)
MAKTLAYLNERAGTEFDPDLVRSFSQMLNEGDAQLRVLHDDRMAVTA